MVSQAEDFEGRIEDGLTEDLEEELNRTDRSVLRELLKTAEDPDCHGYTLDDLVEETGRSKGHLSNRVNFLEKQGLVERFKIWNQPTTPFRLIQASSTHTQTPLFLLNYLTDQNSYLR